MGGFIKGSNIHDCTCLASEAVNVLDNKHWHGNLVLKVDIAKTFDTISCDFLVSVLAKFGFFQKLYDCIITLLSSAFLSMNFNGHQQGYFKCNKDVRQGDLLSPLFFCLIEDEFSRGIFILVNQGGLGIIKSSRNNYVPSHFFMLTIS